MTHRFHPLFGQDFEFVVHRRNWGEDRVYCRAEDGGLFSLPASWTDVVGEDPFAVVAAGRCPFSVDGLLGLAAVVDGLRSQSERDPRRRVLGEDDFHTLASANNLGVDLRSLGFHAQAREIHEETLNRRRRLLGEDHPQTLMSASNLAADLRALGRHDEARRLDEDTLARRRWVLGEDHHLTLTSASDLATDLRALDAYAEAYQLDIDTLARRRRVLGDDHPETLLSATNVAADERALGRDRHGLPGGGPADA